MSPRRGAEESFGGEASARVVAPLVDCPACSGYGYRNEYVRPTSNPHVICDVVSHDCPYCAGTGSVAPEDAELIA